MTAPIHVVAVAARTPVGLRADATAAAVRAGISRVGLHPVFADANGENVRCGYDAALGPQLFGTGRLVALARPVLGDLGRALMAGGSPLGTVPIYLALPDPRPGFTTRDAQDVTRALASTPVPGVAAFAAQQAGSGHAGVLACVAAAVTRLGRGEGDLYVVAGVESYLDGPTLDWLEENRLLDREGIRGGFPPGEGAAMLALASDAGRRRLGLPSLATVRATACEVERRDPNGPEGPLGEAMTAALERVGASLRRPGERFDDFYCDVNGERPRTTDLGFALMRTSELFRDAADYRTAVSRVGDLGAATGALSCILAAQAWARGYASGSTALVAGSSWSGLRGAVLLASGER